MAAEACYTSNHYLAQRSRRGFANNIAPRWPLEKLTCPPTLMAQKKIGVNPRMVGLRQVQVRSKWKATFWYGATHFLSRDGGRIMRCPINRLRHILTGRLVWLSEKPLGNPAVILTMWIALFVDYDVEITCTCKLNTILEHKSRKKPDMV